MHEGALLEDETQTPLQDMVCSCSEASGIPAHQLPTAQLLPGKHRDACY